MNATIIIPSLDPSSILLEIVDNLHKNGFKQIVIVDDGSKSNVIFEKLEENTAVIHHAINIGKGKALKTGIRNAIDLFPNTTGYIFMDADGQHAIMDVLKISKEMEKTHEIILGTRDFNDENVPLRSKLGNKFSSLFFKMSTGKTLSDTQTGLRAIPVKYTELLLKIDGSRYEYEMNFLNYIALHDINYQTINIKTIYENNNKGSHFHTISDSIRIYHEPLKYILVALSSFVIDIGIFILINKFLGLIFLANIMSRLISGLYNYSMNRYWCFKSYSKNSPKIYFCILYSSSHHPHPISVGSYTSYLSSFFF